ncbi:hypothetical protein [Sporosarcina sp. OR05]|uniref:hypothetical protein n=1 Tax=Sporosarcina sp. OR05 TaxID=2969819 RepID=UPI00352A17AD
MRKQINIKGDMEMYTNAIIWGDYPETETLIENLRAQATDLITVVTNEKRTQMNKYEGVVYITSDLVAHGRDESIQEVHYKYVPRHARVDNFAWKMIHTKQFSRQSLT